MILDYSFLKVKSKYSVTVQLPVTMSLATVIPTCMENISMSIVGPQDNAELVVEPLSCLYVITVSGENTGGILTATGAHELTRFYAFLVSTCSVK